MKQLIPAFFSLLVITQITACGGGGGGGSTPAPLLVIVAPSQLSYLVPIIEVGASQNIVPVITGKATLYSITPSLPVGLSIDSNTGTIAGLPSAPSFLSSYTITATNTAGSTQTTIDLSVHSDTRPQVKLTITAEDNDADSLNFEWRVTDGSLSNTTGATVDWTLPKGPGIHFAYALVGDNAGGYQEKRIAVNTDSFGTLTVETVGNAIVAPPAPLIPGKIIKGNVHSEAHVHDETLGEHREVLVPNAIIRVVEYDFSNNLRGDVLPNLSARSDLQGDIAIPLLPLQGFKIECSVDNGITYQSCNSSRNLVSEGLATYSSFGLSYYDQGLQLFGQVSQADGSPCGTRNFLFDKKTTSVVTLKAADGSVITDQNYEANRFGNYHLFTGIPSEQRPSSATLNVQCESVNVVKNVSLPVWAGEPDFDQLFESVQLPNNPPEITSMNASLGNTIIAQLGASSAQRPSDLLPDPERFFSYKGIDSRLSACHYYKAIGVASSCDSKGNILSGTTLDIWKRDNKLAPYNTNVEHTAVFVNEVDLNLTRVHHGTKISDNHLAFYICNHLGPSDTSQTAVNIAIDNAVNGKNLVACVAMDYSISPGVNNDIPFIKYLIFGPSGELLPSINLDGRREKFAPGVCVSCHGGDFYAGRYPEDGTGVANVGVHYLPFDIDNFSFSSVEGLTKEDQLAEIKELNQLLLESNPSPSLTNLITNWYASGNDTPNEDFIPESWTAQGSLATEVYTNMIKPLCRTCHIAFPNYDFEEFNGGWDNKRVICGGDDHILRDNSMPNSPVTYDIMINDGKAIPSYIDYKKQFDPDFTCNPGALTGSLPND